MRRYYLVFETGSLQKTIYPLLEATTIGRDTSNSIRLPDATASRNHARVRFWQGSWVVEDVGSTNGIIINGERVGKASLKPGDSFRIGQTIFTLVEREIAKSKDPLHTTLLVLSTTIEGVESPAVRHGTDDRARRLMEVIAKIPFFVPLRQTDRQQLAESATVHRFSAGELIIQEGDPGRSIYAILDGQVKVFTTDQGGKERELAMLKAGQFFGEMSLVSGKPRSSSITAIDTVVLVEFSYISMLNIIKQNADVRKVLVEYYTARKRDSEEKRARI
jgi:pSer/pThr/pTyr-binding forkhead associated (FHA) protein